MSAATAQLADAHVHEWRRAVADRPPIRAERRRQEKIDDRAARIHEAVDILCHGVVEIRALDGRLIHSGYYDTRTPEGVTALVRDVLQLDGRVTGLYYTLNEIDPRCLRRAHNKMRMRVGDRSTTSDTNVTRRRLLGFDFDVKRPADTSATDAEVQAALAIANDAKAWLIEIGVPVDAVIYGMTGNGACLLIRIDEPNEAATTRLIQRCISAMACRWNTPEVVVDPAVFNASRIWRLPGTLAAKGDRECPDAPQRRAEILEAGAATGTTCPRDVLDRLAACAPAEDKPGTKPSASGGFDLGKWITDHGIDVKAEGPWEDGRRWKLASCLTDSTHTSGEAYIVQRANGGIAAGCQHASCTWGWREYREHYEPGCYEARQQASDPPRTAPRFSFVTDAEIEQHAPPDFLIQNLIVTGSFVLIVGEPGSMKSFLALDLAASIRAGILWVGRPVKAGPVVYVLAEGRGLFSLRIRAWKQHHGYEGDLGVRFLLQPVQLVEHADVSAILAAIAALPEAPVLVIFDTLARCAVGVNENSAEEMGAVVAGADRIREATGAAVILLHHTPRGEERERGSVALRAASDTLIHVLADGEFVTVSARRQKDIDEGEPLLFRKRIVELEDGRTSCVLVPVSDSEQHRAPRGMGDLPESERRLLQAIHRGEASKSSASQMMKAAELPERSYYRALRGLRDRGLVARKGRHQLTDEGLRLLGADPDEEPE